jgi:hypothetical protein
MGLFKDCGCGCDGKKQEQKLLISIMSALVFFIIANPDTFRLMRKVFGSWVSSPTGCPSIGGLVLHTIVFALVTWGLMNVKSELYEPTELPQAIGPAPMADEADDEADDETDDEADDETDDETDDELDSSPLLAPGPMNAKTDSIVSVPRMVDVELPKPYMKEKKVEIRDSGRMFSPMDLNSDLGTLAPVSFSGSNSKTKAVATCKLDDGRKVTFN